jgi:hypothetical protein
VDFEVAPMIDLAARICGSRAGSEVSNFEEREKFESRRAKTTKNDIAAGDF